MHTDTLPGGLWPVMLTPFLDNNQVDTDGLQVLTDFYISAGARGLFTNCLSSEMFQLTDEERLHIIRSVVKATGSRVPVVASGTFSSDMVRCSEFIKQVYDAGAEAVIIITNQLAEMNEDEDIVKTHIELLLTLTGEIPLGLYECPAPYKRLLSPELMQWLGKTNRFFYHKDTSCDLESIKAKLAATRGTLLSLYNANTATALASIENGAAGISPIGANFYPELYAFLIREYEAYGNTENLAPLNAQLDIMDAIADQHYPFSAKLFLQQRGLPISTACRIPSGKMASEDQIKLRALMKIFKQTAEKYHVRVI